MIVERKIGEKFLTPEGVELEVVEKYDMCNGCYYYEKYLDSDIENCSIDEIAELLGDCKRVIFKQTK